MSLLPLLSLLLLFFWTFWIVLLFETAAFNNVARLGTLDELDGLLESKCGGGADCGGFAFADPTFTRVPWIGTLDELELEGLLGSRCAGGCDFGGSGFARRAWLGGLDGVVLDELADLFGASAFGGLASASLFAPGGRFFSTEDTEALDALSG